MSSNSIGYMMFFFHRLRNEGAAAKLGGSLPLIFNCFTCFQLFTSYFFLLRKISSCFNVAAAIERLSIFA